MQANICFPLSGVIESKKYPHARTLRSSFPQKLQDAFNAFQGNDEKHLGIFDYLTAGIRIAFLKASNRASSKSGSIGYSILYRLTLIPVLTLQVSAFIFAAAATIIFSPVIAIVHCIASLVARKDRESALNLELIDNENNNVVTLKDFCQTTNLNRIKIKFLSAENKLIVYNGKRKASLELNNLGIKRKLIENSLFALNVSGVAAQREIPTVNLPMSQMLPLRGNA